MSHQAAEGRASAVLRTLPLVLLSACASCVAQVANSGERATISVDVDLVVLHATVRDHRGASVPGLNRDDFQVFENGVRQNIRFVEREDAPVAVGLIVDNSGSMRQKRDDVVAAALVFARSSNPYDAVFVVNFNERVTLGLPATRLFSASAGDLTEALKGVPADGQTALYDAILTGFDRLKKASFEKKVLIVISDGGDNSSRRNLGDVLRAASLSNAVVYPVGLFDENSSARNPGVLRKIARATGGEVFLPKNTRDVVRICRRVAQDIRSQYAIGYVSADPNLDGSYRRIVVTARGPRGRKLVVRTRPGYLASPEWRRSTAPQGATPR